MGLEVPFPCHHTGVPELLPDDMSAHHLLSREGILTIFLTTLQMKFNWRQLNPFWFLLFPANKFVLTLIRKALTSLNLSAAALRSFQVVGANPSDLVPETWVAWAVFAITFFLFMRFTVDVIAQITECLGINCLTIKKKAA